MSEIITITVSPRPDGKVEVKCNPSVETLLKKINQGSEELTAAEGYVFTMLNAVRKASQAKSIIIEMPLIKGSLY